jgi:hypothetical protein
MRDHEPVTIDSFMGLWRRGSPSNTPPDHFSHSINLKYLEDGIIPRPAAQPFQDLANPLGNVLRQYHYILPAGSTQLTLIEGGDIYHVIDATTVLGPILSIADMTDFGFQQFGINAYLSPAFTNDDGHQVGMEDEILYVYKGDGVNARAAAGAQPTNTSALPFTVFNAGIVGVVTLGVHFVGVAYQNGGVDGIVGPEVIPVVTAPGDQQVQVVNLPIGPVGTTTRIVVMTRAIDPKSYVAATPTQFYEVIRIADNTTTSLLINTADAALVTAYVPGATAAPVTGALRAKESATDGWNDRGFHIIAVVYETDTGYLTKPGPEFFAGLTTVNVKKSVDVSGIPIGPATVIRRHLVASKVIVNYNGDQLGYQLFFIPTGTIDDNTSTTKNLSWFDSELLEDASYLIYNLEEIPAGVILSRYHQRLVSVAEFDSMSLARVSHPGEPESVSELDGFILVPPVIVSETDSPSAKPLTNAQEFRDILYLFQNTRTISYADNEEEPASWPDVVLDQGTGTQNHGIATVLDSGGVNVDYLLIADYSGVFVFNGAYSRPELTYKINDLWAEQDRDEFFRIQMINDSVNKILYVILPDGTLLVGDYTKGLNPKSIIWTVWTFDFLIRSIMLMNIDTLVIGAFDEAP